MLITTYKLIALLSTLFFEYGDADVLPSIVWDPSNPLFSCPNAVINVHYDDVIYFVHPNSHLFTELSERTENQIFYNKIYLVDQTESNRYETCNSTGLTTGKNDLTERTTSDILNNDGKTVVTSMATFREFGDIFNLPSFKRGNTYYFFSTSDGSKAGISNSINGTCSGGGEDLFPLRIKIKVCSEEGEKDKTCERCNSAACYMKDCGFSEWVKDANYFWDGTNCYEKSTRKCESKYACLGSTTKQEKVSNDKCSNVCLRSSIFPTKSIVTSSTKCPTETIRETVSITKTQQCTPTAVISKSLSVTTVTVEKTRTLTQTQTITTTVSKAQSCSVSVSVSPPITERVIQYEDIPYDKKFYITVISAIIGAIVVGVFVLHACVSYFQGKRLATRVVNIEQYNSLKNESVVHVEEFKSFKESDDASSSKVSQNGTLVNTVHS